VLLVVLVGEDRADESEHHVVVGKDGDDIGAPFQHLVHPFEVVRGPDLSTVVPREGGVGGHAVLGVRKHGCGIGQGAFEAGRGLDIPNNVLVTEALPDLHLVVVKEPCEVQFWASG
jgi:hypothetical protein